METQEDIVDALAHAAIRGRLGLFIGAGFSKAVTLGKAPTWLALLEEVCLRLELDMPRAKEGVGTTFPQMASRLVAQVEEGLISEKEKETTEDGRFRKRALWKFKSEVAEITKELRVKDDDSWRRVLEELDPAWIVTTNYDLLIEEILPHTTTLRPSEVMSHSRGGTPVYHMHGHQEEPHALVITEEDYTRLFRPGEYRQQKLPILIAESVVLFLGYGLGDTNILTAIDLASMYRTPDNAQLVQLLWKDENREKKNDEPYKGASTETVVEVFQIRAFLEKVKDRVLSIKKEQEDTLQRIVSLQECPTERRKLADEDIESWLALIKHARDSGSTGKVFEIIVILTKELGQEVDHDWAAYKKLLTVVIFGFVGLGGVGMMHPALIIPLYNAFARISAFIDPVANGALRTGFAWEASRYWHEEKAQISEPLVRQLRSRAAQDGESGDRVKLLLEGLHQWSFPQCEECGASISTECQTCGAATGGISSDEKRDDTYFEIHCHDCGWAGKCSDTSFSSNENDSKAHSLHQ